MRRGVRLQGEVEQRYWRSRGNRRVRKARRTRSVTRWVLILALNATVLGALAWSGARTLEHLRRSEEFALTRVDLRGPERASREDILALLSGHLGRNLLDLDLEEVEVAVCRDPWVRRASVRRMLPGTLRVEVEERQLAARAWLADRPHLLDTTGYVVGPSDSAEEAALPMLTGLDGMGDDELRAALRRGALLVGRLRTAHPEFARMVREIDLSRTDRVVVSAGASSSRILLDPERVERNLSRYIQLREQIDRMAGPVDYVDLRWRGRISVMPSDQNSKGEDG